MNALNLIISEVIDITTGETVYGHRVIVRFDGTNGKGEKARRRAVKTVWVATPEQALEVFEAEYGVAVDQMDRPYVTVLPPLGEGKAIELAAAA